MKSARVFALVAVVAAFAFFVPASAAAATGAGCVMCHTGDRVIPNMLAKISGHPNVTKIVKSVPDGCAMCHKPGAKAPALMNAIHTVHKIPLATASTKAADVKGSCLNCHIVSGDKIQIKTAPANW